MLGKLLKVFTEKSQMHSESNAGENSEPEEFSDFEKRRALQIFNETITEEFLRELNHIFITKNRQAPAWRKFINLINAFQSPEANEHCWNSLLIGAVKRCDVVMVKLCAQELFEPDSTLDNEIMQSKLRAIVDAPERPYMHVYNQGERTPRTP